MKKALGMPRVVIETNDRVCFWGARAALSPEVRLVRDCLIDSGQNFGNFFIGNGLFNATNAQSKEYWNFYRGTPEEFDEKFDALFIPASNFIFKYTDLTAQFDFFSKTKAKIFMFGLGSQIREIGQQIDLPEGTRKFIQLVADRGSSIGVRGSITADILRGLGILNVEVTGCPSMLNIPTGFSPVPDLDNPMTILSGNFTNNARKHAFSADALERLESSLIAELIARRGFYVLQNEIPEIDLMRSLAHTEQLTEADIHNLRCFKSLFNLKSDDNLGLIQFLSRNTRLFMSVFDWYYFMKSVDFSFGTRFHGNVAAIMAGRPAFIFCHDYRTLELAEFYRFPHCVVDSNSTLPSLREVLAATDMSHFQANVPALFDTWASFIRRNGFAATIQLENDNAPGPWIEKPA